MDASLLYGVKCKSAGEGPGSLGAAEFEEPPW